MVDVKANSVQLVSISDIKERAGNPKVHTEDQIQRIMNSIRELGFNDPVSVDSEGVLVEGHGRLEAARRLGLTELPVVQLNMSGSAADVYTIMHNRTTLETGMDLGKVVETFEGLGIDRDEATLSGLSEVEFDMNTAESRNTSEVYFAVDRIPDHAKVDDSVFRKTVLRFSSPQAHEAFIQLLTRLRAAWPGEPTHAARLLRYSRWWKTRTA